MSSKWREEITNEYLKFRVCNCTEFIYADDFNWDKCFQELTKPPTCQTCNKWQNRVHTCLHCKQQYYQFFSHPLMGREASIKKFPWECWDCLETWVRWVTCPVNVARIPPPERVLVPTRAPQVAQRSDDYNRSIEFLNSLLGG